MNPAEQRGSFFLDTNVFVYSFDRSDPRKQAIAQRLIQDALRTQRGVVSSQVVQEFLNVALRKFARPMTVSEGREYLKMTLMPLCHHYPSASFYDHALLLEEETGFSFYDALVVAASVELKCTTLLSEDLQHGRTVRGVTILNPFAVT